MGAAGDMLMGALYELVEDQKTFLSTMNRLTGGVSVTARKGASHETAGTYMDVLVDGEEERVCGDALDAGGMAGRRRGKVSAGPSADMAAVLAKLPVPDEVARDVRAVYNRILEAEAEVHGVPVGQIHFSRLGDLDALADITGVCLAIHMLKPDSIRVSPICVGTGQVRCACGILPVPAPATAILLRGAPCYAGEIRGELCTPTGAALLTYFGRDFGPPPLLRRERQGYGLGKKVLPVSSYVRAVLGESSGFW